MKNKKSQGINVNTIIIGAIALIALVVFIAVGVNLDGWNPEKKAEICYLEGNMGGSEVSIRSSIDGKCAFPFTYTVNESDELYLTFRNE